MRHKTLTTKQGLPLSKRLLYFCFVCGDVGVWKLIYAQVCMKRWIIWWTLKPLQYHESHIQSPYIKLRDWSHAKLCHPWTGCCFPCGIIWLGWFHGRARGGNQTTQKTLDSFYTQRSVPQDKIWTHNFTILTEARGTLSIEYIGVVGGLECSYIEVLLYYFKTADRHKKMHWPQKCTP